MDEQQERNLMPPDAGDANDQPQGEGREAPLVDHLEELRGRLIKSLLALAVGLLVAIAAGQPIIQWLIWQSPLSVTALSPTEVFSVWLRVGVWGGLILASPVILYQAIAFVLPALMPEERRYLWTLLPIGLLLFLIGIGFGYFVLLPLSLRFFITLNREVGIGEPIFPLKTYLDMIFAITVPLGITFELPVVVWGLSQVGIVTSAMLKRVRKFSVLLVFIVAAFLSPGGSPVDQVLMAIPLLLLYEASILVARAVERRKARQDAQEE